LEFSESANKAAAKSQFFKKWDMHSSVCGAKIKQGIGDFEGIAPVNPPFIGVPGGGTRREHLNS
jgi:hypothetical protein